MASFADRLREEIEYIGISQRELAEKAEIKKRALDMYLGYRESMPPADVAVRIANVLNVSVEYLVTGEQKGEVEIHRPPCVQIEEDLKILPKSVQESVSEMIHTLAEREKAIKNSERKNMQN